MIKLGGSVLTDKEKRYTFNTRTAKRIFREIKKTSIEDYIIVHGGGSFGHPGAEKYGLNDQRSKRSPEGLSKVQLDMRRMNHRVLEIMQKLGMFGVSIPGGLVTLFENGVLKEINEDIFKKYASLDVIPVAFGDVTIDEQLGITICSGDDLMMGLSNLADKAIFVTDVDGIYKKNELIETFTEEMYPLREEDFSQRKDKMDVTGGMNEKVKKILEVSDRCETFVVNGEKPDRLAGLLRGDDVICTQVR